MWLQRKTNTPSDFGTVENVKERGQTKKRKFKFNLYT